MASSTFKFYTINIPTKSYLKKYLVGKYGHPIILNYSTLIGSTVLAFLSKKIPTDTSDWKKDIRYRSFTDEIWFKIAASQVQSYHHGMNITQQQVIVINRHFENEFEEYLFHFCNYQIAKNTRTTRKRSIELFAETFNIEIDLDVTFECLKKSDYRTGLKFKNISDAFVPQKQSAIQPTLFQ